MNLNDLNHLKPISTLKTEYENYEIAVREKQQWFDNLLKQKDLRPYEKIYILYLN